MFCAGGNNVLAETYNNFDPNGLKSCGNGYLKGIPNLLPKTISINYQTYNHFENVSRTGGLHCDMDWYNGLNEYEKKISSLTLELQEKSFNLRIKQQRETNQKQLKNQKYRLGILYNYRFCLLFKISIYSRS